MRLSRRKWLFLPLGLVLAAAGYMTMGGNGAARPDYKVAAVERGTLTVAIDAVGTVNATRLVQVGAEISGRIQELHADFNSEVRAGDLLAVIAPENFQARVDQVQAELEMASARIMAARVRLDRARAEKERMQAQTRLHEARKNAAALAAEQAARDLQRKAAQRPKGFVSPSDYEQAELARATALSTLAAAEAEADAHLAALTATVSDVEAAEVDIRLAEADRNQAAAALRQAEADLRRTRIASPIEGVVIERNVDVGQTVAASLQAPTLFTIAHGLENLQVETYVDETDIGRVRAGQEATFTVGAFPGRTFTGRVVEVRRAPLVIQNVVAYMVVVSVGNESLELLPGMTATVRVVTDRVEEARLVPSAALRFRPAAENRRSASAARAADRGAEGGPGRRTGRVYVLAQDGSLSAVPLALGATDGARTEILDGPLGEGDAVVVGVSGTSGQSSWRRWLGGF